MSNFFTASKHVTMKTGFNVFIKKKVVGAFSHMSAHVIVAVYKCLSIVKLLHHSRDLQLIKSKNMRSDIHM